MLAPCFRIESSELIRNVAQILAKDGAIYVPNHGNMGDAMIAEGFII